jgi:hypothetical protein
MIGLFATDTSTQDGRDELRSGGNRYALYCFIVAISTFPSFSSQFPSSSFRRSLPLPQSLRSSSSSRPGCTVPPPSAFPPNFVSALSARSSGWTSPSSTRTRTRPVTSPLASATGLLRSSGCSDRLRVCFLFLLFSPLRTDLLFLLRCHHSVHLHPHLRCHHRSLLRPQSRRRRYRLHASHPFGSYFPASPFPRPSSFYPLSLSSISSSVPLPPTSFYTRSLFYFLLFSPPTNLLLPSGWYRQAQSRRPQRCAKQGKP